MKRSAVLGAVAALVAAAGAVLAFRALERYPFSEPAWRGGRAEYLKAVDLTIVVWDDGGRRGSGRVLFIAQRGDRTRAGDGFFSTMKTELDRLNDAEFAAWSPFPIDARSSKAAVVGDDIVVTEGAARLVVHRDFSRMACEQDPAPAR